jgi:AraC-like DNA-binding protein
MKTLDEIISEIKKDYEQPEHQEKMKFYGQRALSELRDHNYYTVTPHGGEATMFYPFDVSLHEDGLIHPAPFHNHNFFELVYVYRGNCINVSSGIEAHMQEKDLLFMTPDTLHYLRVPDQSSIIFNFLITKDVFRQSMFSLMSNDVLSNFVISYFYQLQKSVDFLILNRTDDSPIYSILHRLIQEYYQPQPGYEKILEAGLIEVFLYMSRILSSQFTPSGQLPTSQFLSSIILYIQKNYSTVTLKEVAYTFGYTEKYISRCIKKELKTSFSDFIKDIRLTHAAQYLSKTTMSVEQIAQMVGYQNMTYFYSIFRNKFQMSPKEYRLADFQHTESDVSLQRP